QLATGVGFGFGGMVFDKYGFYSAPSGVRVDHSGNIVFADTDCQKILVRATTTGTFYGKSMTAGHVYTIDRSIAGPAGIAVDHAGNVVIASPGANAVAILAARPGHFYGRAMAAGHSYVLAGQGKPGYRGDGGQARRALLDEPVAVAVDGHGNIAIADYGNHRVR